MSKKVPGAFGLGLLLILTGCGPSGPLLKSDGNTAEGVPRIHQGDTVTIGSMFGCLDKSGSVTVTDISPMGETGLKVTGWAVRPNPFWKPLPADHPGPDGQVGVTRMTLAELQFPTSRGVDAQCGKHGEGFEFAVQVQKTTDGEAGASGWVVTYASGGDTKKERFLRAIRLCSEGNVWAKRCQALKV